MLVVRNEQTVQMHAAMSTTYYRQIANFYRKEIPHLVSIFSDSQLLHRTKLAVQKAREWGIRDGEGIAQFVLIAIAAGAGFDEDPKIRHFLSLPGFAPEQKIRRLLEFVLEDLQEMQRASPNLENSPET